MNVPSSTRRYWQQTATRLMQPVLDNLASRTLLDKMPQEKCSEGERSLSAHLEAFGRLIVGIAPWLELAEQESLPWRTLALEGIAAITDPTSPDYGHFEMEGQPLVDTAFLAQGIMRAPRALWEPLSPAVRSNVIAAFKKTRATRPHFNNWLLFSAMVEAALFSFGENDWDRMRIDYALRQHEQWYQGDGVYGDGPSYHADYYNSFVIHPMLNDLARVFARRKEWTELFASFEKRAERYASYLERIISPEGTFPPVGRSLSYRFGAFHALAQSAWQERLPMGVTPAQVRCALTAVIRRTMEAPHTFDEGGWLRLGFCGAQPQIGERYINTGSLYLCTAGLLPLGLSLSAPFWSDPDEPWTAVKAWSGAAFPIDSAH